MGRRVVVAGVGMIPFSTPRKSEPFDVMVTQENGELVAELNSVIVVRNPEQPQ